MSEKRELDDVSAAAGLRLAGLPPAPKDVGVVVRVVQRVEEGVRRTPERVVLDTEEGVVGDRWGLGERDLEDQVTLMRADVAAALCPEATYEIFGDNIFAVIDTGATNLPPGTLMRVGSARCVVTPKPHHGCAKFMERGVAGALALIMSEEHRDAQLRGVHLRVLAAGTVGVGDRLVVESRP